jgi:S-(hydroxymethyl)glutathione dehydrogenase / alcohol dehydrogenase
MRAAVCREFKKPLAVEQVNLAEPYEGEVKVRVSAWAICHSDLLYMDGTWGGDLPAVFGHEAAGNEAIASARSGVALRNMIVF